MTVIVTTIEDNQVGYAELEAFSFHGAVKWICGASDAAAEHTAACLIHHTHTEGGLTTLVVYTQHADSKRIFFIGREDQWVLTSRT